VNGSTKGEVDVEEEQEKKKVKRKGLFRHLKQSHKGKKES